MPVIEKPNPVQDVNYDQMYVLVPCPMCGGSPTNGGKPRTEPCRYCKGEGTMTELAANWLRRMSAD